MNYRSTALIVASAAAVLAAAAGLTGRVQLVPDPALPPSATVTGGCMPAQVQSQTLVDAAGRKVSPERADGTAVTQDTEYRLGPGETVSVETPPPGYRAATASPAERSLIGLASLPPGVRRFVSAPGVRYVPSGTLCQVDGASSLPDLAGSHSPNWPALPCTAKAHAASSGRPPRAGPSRISRRHARSRPTTRYGLASADTQTATSCRTGSNTVIGDWRSNPDAVFAWWEMISPGYTGPMVRVSGLPVHAGDSMTVLTEYLAARGMVIFWFLDRTTGKYKEYMITRYAGHPASSFYDGESAEVVNENAGAQYREPVGGITHVFAVDFDNGQPVAALAQWARVITMTRFRNGGPVIDSPFGLETVSGPSVLRSSEWSDLWRSCN